MRRAATSAAIAPPPEYPISTSFSALVVCFKRVIASFMASITSGAKRAEVQCGDKNSSETYKWFDGAAKGWDRNAQFQLGKRYMTGEGVKADLIEAYKWFDLAASAGHDDAHFYRAAVATKISADDKKRAHAQAQEWFDANHTTVHRHYDMTPHRH